MPLGEMASFPGRPSALAQPFVPSAARRIVQRPSPPPTTTSAWGGGGGGGSGTNGNHSTPNNRRGGGRRPPTPRGHGETYASGELREHAREEATLLARNSAPGLEVPEYVGAYGMLYPLEEGISPSLLPLQGCHIQLYKAICGTDGEASSLMRVVGIPPASSTQIVRASECWRRVRHSGISTLREVFSATSFNPSVNEVFLSYAFPGRARPFSAAFLPTLPRYGAPSRTPAPLPEDALWALSTQLLSAVHECHKWGLALRGALHPSAVLVVGRNRVRLFGVGVNDILDPTGAEHLPMRGQITENEKAKTHMKGDLNALANLLLMLALRSNMGAVRGGVLTLGLAHSLDVLRRSTPYTGLFIRTVEVLADGATSENNSVTIVDVLQTASTRITEELGNVWGHSDNLTKLLFDELENSRMLRLIALISYVTERNESTSDQAWSETGDRYVVKLFRDYLFHREDDNGRAVLDMAAVVECLHRLDIGSQEQVLLSARDGKSLIVASYDEIRRCLLQSVDELMRTGHKQALSGMLRNVGASTLGHGGSPVGNHANHHPHHHHHAMPRRQY